MLCVQIAADGSIVAADPQPVEVGGCALVVTSGADAINSPFAITPEQGSEIGGAILLVWAVAYTFRVVIRALQTVDEKGDST